MNVACVWLLGQLCTQELGSSDTLTCRGSAGARLAGALWLPAQRWAVSAWQQTHEVPALGLSRPCPCSLSGTAADAWKGCGRSWTTVGSSVGHACPRRGPLFPSPRGVRRAGSSPQSEVCHQPRVVQAQRGVQEGTSQVTHWKHPHTGSGRFDCLEEKPGAGCMSGWQLQRPLCWWEVALGRGKFLFTSRLLWSWFGVLFKFTELWAPAETV